MKLKDADKIISQCEEYANLLKYDGSTEREWATVKRIMQIINEAPTIESDPDTISRQDAIEHLKKRLYESALNNEGVVSETMAEIADNRIQIWMDELPPSPSRP